MNRWYIPKGWVAIISVVAISLVGLFIVITAGSSSAPGAGIPIQPSPNGYEDFLKAAQLSKGAPPANADQLKHDESEQLVAQNAESLRLVRSGLTRESIVPVDFMNGEAYLKKHHPELDSIKKLARIMNAQGNLLERDGRTNDACRVYIDITHLGQELCRGGVISDRLVGAAVEELGMKGLERILSALDATTCRATARTLEALNAKREPVTETIRLEDLFIRRGFGWYGKVIRVVQFRTYKKVRQTWQQNANRHESKMQALITQLAQRAYFLVHGREPDRLDQLVPEYLTSIPPVPGSGTAPGQSPNLNQ